MSYRTEFFLKLNLGQVWVPALFLAEWPCVLRLTSRKGVKPFGIGMASTPVVGWCSLKHFFFFFLLLVLLPKTPQYIVVYSSCRSFWLCCVGRCLSMAWWAMPCSCSGSELAKPRATEAECTNLTTQPRGPPQMVFHLLIADYFFIHPLLSVTTVFKKIIIALVSFHIIKNLETGRLNT